MQFLINKRVVIISMISTLIMGSIVMLFVDPLIDGGNGFGVIALQLSFDKLSAQEIVSTWNIAAFHKWIIMDYIYALSYMTFFASLILWLEKRKGLAHSYISSIALGAGIFDWIENSLELWFLQDMEAFSSTLFFIHSVLATLKWLALPIILATLIKLYRMNAKDIT